MALRSEQLLANAIVVHAARDYERYLVAEYNCNSPKEMAKIKAELRDLESFFKGDWIKMLTTLDGVTLMACIKANVEKFNYDLKALNKARGKNEDEEDTYCEEDEEDEEWS